MKTASWPPPNVWLSAGFLAALFITHRGAHADAANALELDHPRRIALRVEPTFGVGEGSFANQLAGGRFDYRFTPSWSLGIAIAYANLKGPEGRAHNILPAVELEWRLPMTADGSWAAQFRWSTGYLPKNGPVLRTSVGTSYALTPRWQLGWDIVAPTFWVVRDRTVLSVGSGLEGSYAF